jgi:hypothetical protein
VVSSPANVVPGEFSYYGRISNAAAASLEMKGVRTRAGVCRLLQESGPSPIRSTMLRRIFREVEHTPSVITLGYRQRQMYQEGCSVLSRMSAAPNKDLSAMALDDLPGQGKSQSCSLIILGCEKRLEEPA